MKKVQIITELSVFLAVALILSYVEHVVFSDIVMPGIKLGISNITVLLILYRYNFPTALGFGVVKSSLSVFFTGRFGSLFFSLSGIVLAVIVMALLKKSEKFSLLGVNVSGSVSHIIGQLCVAMFVIGSDVWRILPLLMIFAVISGILMYFPAMGCLKQIEKSEQWLIKNS